jgi:bifunctional DNA-binding transcriptional regulator/antitoxin component of YhaV-PrlF toxin-antitoxin module
MRVEVSENGEIVIPKEVAEAAGFVPGCSIETIVEAGALTLETESVPMRLERKHGLPVLVPERPVPPLTTEDVAAIFDEVRFDRFRANL